jgi:hypothetical protein
MVKANSKSLKKFLPVAFLFLLTIIFFYPVIFQGKTFYAFDNLFRYYPWVSLNPNFRAHNPLITDPVNIFYPYHHFYKTCIQEHIWPLWDSSNFCGVEGDFPINPIEFSLYLIFTETTAHDLLLWLHLFGMGLFMYLYLKEIGLNLYPALFGAISWKLTKALVGNCQKTARIATIRPRPTKKSLCLRIIVFFMNECSGFSAT